MGPLERLRGARGYGRTAEQAIQYLIDHNGVVPSIQRDRGLYADLALRFLEWTADLLDLVNRVQTDRATCRPVVQAMSERVDAYFETKSRWPPHPSVLHPLNLMIPASYALRALERVNSRIRPQLLTLDTSDAHDFAREILGPATTMSVSQHKNHDLRTLRILVDDYSDASPRPCPGFLSGDQAARLAAARTDPTVRTLPTTVVVPSVVAPPPVPVDDGALRASVWTRKLSGLRISFRPPPAYTEPYGGEAHHRTENSLDLLASGRYRAERTTTVRVFEQTVKKTAEERGSWRVQAGSSFDRLVLTDDAGEETWYRLPKSTADGISLDGERISWRRL